MRFEEEHNAVEFILGFGDRIKVVAPEELRAQVIQQAEATLALYVQVGVSTDLASSGNGTT